MKVCPWCGNTNLEVQRIDGEQWLGLRNADVYSVFCNQCGATGPVGDNEKQAKELWEKTTCDCSD